MISLHTGARGLINVMASEPDVASIAANVIHSHLNI